MTTVINIEDFKRKGKRRYFINIIFISSLLIITIVGAALSLALSSLDYVPNMILNIVITSLVAIFSIFYFLNIFPIVRHYYSYYKGLNNINLEHRKRMVYLKDYGTKEIDKVTYKVVQFVYKEGENDFNDNLYILDNDIKFVPGNVYTLNTYQNVIISYEDIKNATN